MNGLVKRSNRSLLYEYYAEVDPEILEGGRVQA